MLKTLLKMQCRAYFASLLAKSKSGKQQTNTLKIILIAFLFVYLAGAFASMMVGICLALCRILVDNGYAWLYFAIPFVSGFVINVFMGMFSSQAQLFSARDNELLLSMPIKPRYILASRLIMLATPDYLFDLLFAVIAGVVYAMFYGVTPVGIVIYVLITLSVPLLALSVSCLLGWGLAEITARMKHKQLFSTILSLSFILIYFFLYRQFMTAFTSDTVKSIEELALSVEPIATALMKYCPPIFWLGGAVAEHSILFTALTILITAVPFVLTIMLLSRRFIGIATAKRSAKKNVYNDSQIKTGTLKMSLYKRELKRVFGSSVYFMNSCTGGILMLIMPLIIAFSNNDGSLVSFAAMRNELSVLSAIISPCAALLLCCLSSMIFVTAASISMEGKYFWIIRSLPIKTETILFAKIKAHLTISIPVTLIGTTIVAIMTAPVWYELILLYLIPLSFSVFCAFFGLLMNLRFPRLDWLNELQAVKQGMSVFLSMFVPIGVAIVTAAVTVLPMFILEYFGIVQYGAAIGSVLMTALYCVFVWIAYTIIKRWGVRRFESLMF